jgi:hypothetical protein
LSSVIAYPVLGLGYTILRQLFNSILTRCLTKRPLNWCLNAYGEGCGFACKSPIITRIYFICQLDKTVKKNHRAEYTLL